MRTKNNSSVLSALFFAVAAILVIPFMASCGKDGNASPTGLNTQLNIINASPDVLPIDLYITGSKQNLRSFIYGTPSGYIYLNSLDQPLQIRTQKNETIFTADSVLRVNTKYSVFITGLVSDNTRSSIFLTDSDPAPGLGHAKVRFVNASARAVNLDVYANGTLAFQNRGVKAVSKFLELTAGIYDFKLCPANSKTVLFDFPNNTLQDGRLYTIYSRGIVGHTDTSSFSAGIIVNR